MDNVKKVAGRPKGTGNVKVTVKDLLKKYGPDAEVPVQCGWLKDTKKNKVVTVKAVDTQPDEDNTVSMKLVD